MANYTFFCEECGEFTLWFKGTKGNRNKTECPDCNSLSKRVFKPPITFRMDSRVKDRIEQGMEPRVVKKKELPKQSNQRQRAARPWQAGH